MSGWEPSTRLTSASEPLIRVYSTAFLSAQCRNSSVTLSRVCNRRTPSGCQGICTSHVAHCSSHPSPRVVTIRKQLDSSQLPSGVHSPEVLTGSTVRRCESIAPLSLVLMLLLLAGKENIIRSRFYSPRFPSNGCILF
jgi:hypothetical protein